MLAVIFLIAMAKKKAYKFTPAPEPNESIKPEPTPEPIRIDDNEKDAALLFLMLFALMIFFITKCCACDCQTNQHNEDRHEDTTIPQAQHQPPSFESTISYRRYNEVANDTVSTIHDYNTLLTHTREIIGIAIAHGINVKHIPKRLNNYISDTIYRSVQYDVPSYMFNFLVSQNKSLIDQYNQLVDISNSVESVLLNHGVEF